MRVKKLKTGMLTALKSIVFFMGWVLLAVCLPEFHTENKAIWRLWAEITPLLSILICTALFWLMEKKSVKLQLFSGAAKGVFVGSVAGFLWLFVAAGVMLLMGVMDFKGINPVPNLLIWMLAAFLNVAMQELLVRGYLYQMIRKKHSIAAAAITTTGLFVAMHGGALEAGLIPALNVLSMSLLMTVVLEYTGGLIAPIMMHAIWNVAGAIILGGVSLADDYPHLMNTSFTGNPLLSGGDCRIEGSVVVLILNAALIVYFWFKGKREKA